MAVQNCSLFVIAQVEISDFVPCFT